MDRLENLISARHICKLQIRSMKGGLAVILFALFLTQAYSYDDMTVEDLDSETAAELEYLIEEYHDLKETNCSGHPVARSADFFLFNKNNPTKPIVLDGNTITQIKPDKPTIMLIHGWLAAANTSHIIKLKNRYIERYDSNLIMVNWEKQSFQPYTKAYCDVPGIGLAITRLLCTAVRQLNLSLETVHIVGHSMGAQIAGFTGQYVKTQCKQELGRITALDPAGPIYRSIQDGEKLDNKDALFVDVIHTDNDGTGAWRNCGDIDFHPNCGILQPGCPVIKDVVNTTLLSDALCNSLRSLDFMLESMVSNQFIGVSCSRCPEICSMDIINEVYTVMGEECQKPPGPYYLKKFYIPTNEESPYAKGWDPYTYNIEP